MAISWLKMVDGKQEYNILCGLVEGNEEKLWQCHSVIVLETKRDEATKTFDMPWTCLTNGSDSKKTKAKPLTAAWTTSIIMSESQTYGGESVWPRRGQKLTSLRKLSTIRWSYSEEKKRRMVNARSATLMPITIPTNSSVPPMVNLINVLVVTWILISGRKIDSKGGAVPRTPIGRGASIVFRISEAEKNDFCSPAVLSN